MGITIDNGRTVDLKMRVKSEDPKARAQACGALPYSSGRPCRGCGGRIHRLKELMAGPLATMKRAAEAPLTCSYTKRHARPSGVGWGVCAHSKTSVQQNFGPCCSSDP